MNKWIMYILGFLLGMLLANMLKNVCGCKVVEGLDANFLTRANLEFAAEAVDNPYKIGASTRCWSHISGNRSEDSAPCGTCKDSKTEITWSGFKNIEVPHDLDGNRPVTHRSCYGSTWEKYPKDKELDWCSRDQTYTYNGMPGFTSADNICKLAVKFRHDNIPKPPASSEKNKCNKWCKDYSKNLQWTSPACKNEIC